MSRSETKQRILNAAEFLFAREGYNGTSLRAITSKAQVNLAAVNYHFGSKKALLEDVFERRLRPLNKIRKEGLKKVRVKAVKEKREVTVREIMYAFIEPTLTFKESDPGAEDFIALVGCSFFDPDGTVKNVFFRYMKPMFLQLFEAISEALPSIPRNVLFWRLQFSLGALAHTMRGCDDLLLEPLNTETKIDTDLLVNMIVPYVTAGMEAS
jgi:AcrR family transcriptional regulator